MSVQKALVMGASGFVGSHVTRKLVERGDDVRVLLRRTSPTKGIDDLDVERHYGDLSDERAVREAMADRDVVDYCVVDTRAWLRDPAPLFETNVEGLRRVLDIACEADLRRFVFISTIGTIAIGHGVNEDTPFNWPGKGGPYIESRREAEDLVLTYAHERGLPAVAMCVSNTYGPRDWQPTPHGSMIAMAALGRMPVYVRGVAAEVVGAKPPRAGVPLSVLYASGYATSMAGRVLRRDFPLNLTAVRLLHLTSALDHGKATRELGWQPTPTKDAIGRAARFYVERANRRKNGQA